MTTNPNGVLAFPCLAPILNFRRALGLTDPDDLVVDIFAGSNTTGAAAEKERRRWLAFDVSLNYLAGSVFRFTDADLPSSMMNQIYDDILRGETADLTRFIQQAVLLDVAK
jgi:site-specific DNA-methyltransferase (cytosine-N4-specific)